MRHDFNQNQIARSGKSKCVRTLIEFSREADLPIQRLLGIASHTPLPEPAFEIYKKGRPVCHYEKAALEKWLADWRAKTAKKLESYK